ncbi:hypothetical protein [Aneurinibacillus uraniidurans]|uniref:hypothetical protein n=1 Tax=Aneurinibacillus uraniidurans TaxID=2966586 RepID=UPI00234BAD04|nr:hypothetical protein [Aneurinibacillus sp. B1]WCN36226.1 hypothetical protein PO771_09995 [Aneurinibacillus sp. B1]
MIKLYFKAILAWVLRQNVGGTPFSKDQWELLLKEANSNPQCYEGRYAKTYHNQLLETAKSLLGNDVE